jgi:hypothetical protein
MNCYKNATTKNLWLRKQLRNGRNPLQHSSHNNIFEVILFKTTHGK